MQPMAANERRKGFIDNSLGTKLLEKPVLNYYDNDSIEKGPYKMLVNCYENCFFTYNIIKVMLPKMAIKNTIPWSPAPPFITASFSCLDCEVKKFSMFNFSQ